MNSFTTRPDTQWTAPSTTYQVGGSTQSTANVNTYSSSTSTATGATSFSRAYSIAASLHGLTVADSTRTAFTDGRTSFSSFSASFTEENAPLDNSYDSTFESGATTFRTSRTEADTSRATVQYTSREGSTQYSSSFTIATTTSTDAGSGSFSSSATSTTTSDVGPSTTLRTFSGTASIYSTSGDVLGASTITTSSTNGTPAAFTTATTTLSTTATTQASSSWTTTYTTLSSGSTTYTTFTASVTYANDTTTALTATTHPRTSYAFDTIVQDSVFLMLGGRNTSDYSRGEILWTFANSTFGTDTTTVGIFTELFTSTSAGTITITDYRKFESRSAEVTAVSISSSVSTLTDTAGTTYISRTSTNGSYYSTSTLTSTATTGTGTSTGTSTNTYTSAETTTTYSQSYSLGDVASTTITYTVGTSTLTSSVFTHTAFVSGYETTSSAWTVGTISSTWGFATSGTSSRVIYFSSASTTTALSVRSTTLDSILFSSFTTTSSGTVTGRVTLGLVSTTTSRFYSTEATFTRATYPAELHSTALQFIVTDSNTGGFTTFTRSDSFGITRWTERRLSANVRARPGHDNAPALNEVRHKCYPFGYAGFGGGFTATALSVHLTTSQGLLSGTTFTSVHITPPSTKSCVRGVSFFPIQSSSGFGGLEAAQSTSLLSMPSSMASVLSIAATWTSTTGPESATSITSAFATHTIGVVTPITGEFWSSEALTTNSTFRTEITGQACNGGFAAGDNFLGNTYQVLVRCGRVTWTEFTSTQSTGLSAGSTSSTAGSVSFSLDASKAMVFSVEPVFTAAWSAAGGNSIFSSAPHIPFP